KEPRTNIRLSPSSPHAHSTPSVSTKSDEIPAPRPLDLPLIPHPPPPRPPPHPTPHPAPPPAPPPSPSTPPPPLPPPPPPHPPRHPPQNNLRHLRLDRLRILPQHRRLHRLRLLAQPRHQPIHHAHLRHPPPMRQRMKRIPRPRRHLQPHD